MLIAFGVGGAFLGSLIAIPLVSLMSGKSLLFIAKNLNTLIGNPEYLREMQVLQSISAVFTFLIPTLVVAYLLSHKPLQLSGLKGEILGRQWILCVFIIAGGLALSSALGYFTYKLPFPVNWRILFDRLEDNYAQAASGIISLDSVGELILSIGVLAAIPAICEELFFRAGLQNYLYRGTGRLWFSVIVVSIIFSAVHFSVYGFLSRVALGVVLGLLYQYSGRIWLSILAHFINNAAAVVLMYVQRSSGKPMQDILNDRDGSYLGFLAIPIIILLFIQYRKQSSAATTLTDGI